MTFDWQATAAPLIVVAAIGYLAWRLVGPRFFKSKQGSGCGSCGSCPSGEKRNEPQLVQIGASLSGRQPTATLPTITKK